MEHSLDLVLAQEEAAPAIDILDAPAMHLLEAPPIHLLDAFAIHLPAIHLLAAPAIQDAFAMQFLDAPAPSRHAMAAASARAATEVLLSFCR